MKREVPERWVPYFEAKGLHSYRDLANEAHVGPSTITKLCNGERKPSSNTIKQVARALGISENTVLELANQSIREYGQVPWPPEASRLTPRQQRAVVEIIWSMLDPGREEGGEGRDGGSAPTRPGDGPDNVTPIGKLSATSDTTLAGVAREGEIEPEDDHIDNE